MMLGWNGMIVDGRAAVISVYDHGFMYGYGLFETFRTYRGIPYLLDRHLHRLEQSCHSIGIRFQAEEAEVCRHIAELLEANQLEDAYIRYSVSAGDGELGLPADDYTAPNVIVYMKPLPPPDVQLYDTGKPLHLLHTRRNTAETAVRLKSFHYMNNIAAKRELRQYEQGNRAEGLLLTSDQYLAEGIVSNLFFVEKGLLYTPAVDLGILPGITRAKVIELASDVPMSVYEGHFKWDRLREADEVFLTNSIQEIVPVTELIEPNGNNYRVSGGRIGPLTQQLLQRYRGETARL